MTAVVKPIDVHTQDRFDTEVELLGALLHYGDANSYHAAAAIVSPEQFNDSFNARLFDIIGKSVLAGLQAFKLIAFVMAELREDPTLKDANLTASGMVARYISTCAPQIGIEGCARQIRHDWLNDLLKAAVEDGRTADAEIHAAEMERLRRAHLEKNIGLQSVDALADSVVDGLNELHQNGKAVDDFVFPGSVDLAKVIKGWRRGRFYVIAGRPGIGKSTTALSWLVRTAQKDHGVLFFSLEMTGQELTEMALCDLAYWRERRIEYRDLSSALESIQESENRFNAIRDAAERLAKCPFTVMDRPGLTIAEIRSQAMQHSQRLAAQGKRLEVIAIDHLGLIKPSGSYAGNKVAETEEVSASLKALAKELNIAVISLVQLNRGVESREDKRPGLSDLRWSGAIEQDADCVMFVYREAYYLSKPVNDPIENQKREDRRRECLNEMEVIWAKQRNGPCPTIKFYCDMGCGVVRDLDRAHAPSPSEEDSVLL